ncbi:MAG TPA: 3-isopropylmalate dehydratase small subunit [Candidatus Binatia bacterium]|nr:3-isopropylmalate dehydratase small subunit [Candidatus Binatia bacterium]
MALVKIRHVRGRGVYVPGHDIDTDRIIPARYMKCVTFDGLGAFAFYDVRFDESGRPLGHPLDDPRYRGASILVSGRNFGCGSSREHAPQSLYYSGIRAILAEGFAEIFIGNSTTLGIPCVTLSPADRDALARAIAEHPQQDIEIDLTLAEPTIRFAERTFTGQMPESTRRSLVEGQWDALGQLLDGREAVGKVAARLPGPAKAA